ncbi:MAG: succinylglutamate desuccinylase [Desulfobaccales bacterium]|jgi:hypothetical protein
MNKKSIKILIFSLALTLCVTGAAIADGAKLLCVSNQNLKGQESVSSCLAKGDEFAIVDQYGIVHVLTPREVELTRAFNPNVFQQRAFSIQYERMAPVLPTIFGSTPIPK